MCIVLSGNNLLGKIGLLFFFFFLVEVENMCPEFTPGTLHFVHIVDMCVMKVAKLQTACLHGSLSDAIVYKRDDLLQWLFV